MSIAQIMPSVKARSDTSFTTARVSD